MASVVGYGTQNDDYGDIGMALAHMPVHDRCPPVPSRIRFALSCAPAPP